MAVGGAACDDPTLLRIFVDPDSNAKASRLRSVRHRTDGATASTHAHSVISDMVPGGSRSAPTGRFALPRFRSLRERHPKSM